MFPNKVARVTVRLETQTERRSTRNRCSESPSSETDTSRKWSFGTGVASSRSSCRSRAVQQKQSKEDQSVSSTYFSTRASILTASTLLLVFKTRFMKSVSRNINTISSLGTFRVLITSMKTHRCSNNGGYSTATWFPSRMSLEKSSSLWFSILLQASKKFDLSFNSADTRL